MRVTGRSRQRNKKKVRNKTEAEGHREAVKKTKKRNK